MKRLFFIFVFCAFSMPILGQDLSKPWSDWSKKDAEKILNDSAWGQSFTQDMPVPTSTAATTRTSGGLAGGGPTESGENKAPAPTKYRARLLTAKPIREAFARMIILQQDKGNDELKTQLQGFIDRDFGDYLVVSFAVEGDPRMAKGTEAMLARLTGEMVKDKIYLERKDGKRAVFIDYKPPVGDGMGAKIVFSRTLDGQPFIGPGEDVIKFGFDMSEKQKIGMKFKTSGMTYGGKLEY